MLEQGLIVTVIGMSVVFMFLVLLVFAMLGMSKIVMFINKMFPEQVEAPIKVAARESSDDIAVAIAVAKIKMSK